MILRFLMVVLWILLARLVIGAVLRLIVFRNKSPKVSGAPRRAEAESGNEGFIRSAEYDPENIVDVDFVEVQEPRPEAEQSHR